MRHIAGIVGTLSAVVFLAGSAFAAISGSHHDFTAGGTGKAANQSTEICAVCHVPHQPAQNVPLWSHTLSGETYFLYNSNPAYSSANTAAYGAGFGIEYDFTGSMSAACLSCHDGTVAVIGAITLDSGDDTWMMWDDGSPAAAVANGLMGSHPVGLNYDDILGGPDAAEYNDPDGTPAILEGTSPNRMVQCISCHNAHSVASKMLVEENTGSQLCLRCHNK